MDSALAAQIQAGRRLKKATTNDRSAPSVAGNANSGPPRVALASAPRPPGAGSGFSAPKPPQANAASSASSGPSLGGGPPQLGGLFAGGMPTLRKTGANTSAPAPTFKSAPPVPKPPIAAPPSRAPPVPPLANQPPPARAPPAPRIPPPVSNGSSSSPSRLPPPIPQVAPTPSRAPPPPPPPAGASSPSVSPVIPTKTNLRHVRTVSALAGSPPNRQAPTPPSRPNPNISPPAPPARPPLNTSLSSSTSSLPPPPPARPISPSGHGMPPPPPPPRPQTSNGIANRPPPPLPSRPGARPVPPPPPPRNATQALSRNGSFSRKAPPPPPRPPGSAAAATAIGRPSSTPPRRTPAPPPPPPPPQHQPVVNGSNGISSSFNQTQPGRLPPPPPRPAPASVSNLSASLPPGRNPNDSFAAPAFQPAPPTGISPAARARVMSTPPRPRLDEDESSNVNRRKSMVAPGTLEAPSRRPPSPPTTYSVNPPRNFPGSENFPPPRTFTEGITHQYPSSKKRGCDWDYKAILA